MALLWLGAAATSVVVLRQRLYEAYDESLRQNALSLLPLAVHELSEGDESGAQFIIERGEDEEREESRPVEHDPSFTYLVRGAAGEPLLSDERAPESLANMELPEGFSEIGGQRGFILTDGRSGYSIAILETSDRREIATRDSIATLMLPLLALLPLIAAGVWLAMRIALRPLERLRREIAMRDSRNLAPTTSEGHPVELAPIADAVAALLERLKAALDAERTFASRSAHELRTPIAGALAQTQQLADELSGTQGAERVRDIEAALKRLSQLSEKLLQLARIDAGFANAGTEADQLPALKMVVHDTNANTSWRGRVQLYAGDVATLPAAIDPDAFAIALRNLIENGLKHGARESPVRVTIGADGTVSVRNECASLDAADLARIGQPFVRGETSADGSGLGLAIARGIVEQAGGRLILNSPIAGTASGFEAVIILPLA